MVYVVIAHLQVKESAIPEVKKKLVEYAAAYRKDEDTLAWFVQQDVKEPNKFAIVERYVGEESLKIHAANPVFPTFFPWVKPLLTAPPQILRYNELSVGVPNKESRL